jgi:hypothetical protein
MSDIPHIIPPGGSAARTAGSQRVQRTSGLDDEHLETLANVLDDAFAIPGTNWRVGLDAIVGLVPGVGDLISSAFSFIIVFAAWQRNLPKVTIARMVGNIAIDTLLGALPFVGDIFDAAWKSNKKNVALLKRATHAQQEGVVVRQQAKDWGALLLLIIAAAALVAVPIWVLVWLLRHAF